jgi:hypothetical protein
MQVYSVQHNDMIRDWSRNLHVVTSAFPETSTVVRFITPCSTPSPSFAAVCQAHPHWQAHKHPLHFLWFVSRDRLNARGTPNTRIDTGANAHQVKRAWAPGAMQVHVASPSRLNINLFSLSATKVSSSNTTSSSSSSPPSCRGAAEEATTNARVFLGSTPGAISPLEGRWKSYSLYVRT